MSIVTAVKRVILIGALLLSVPAFAATQEIQPGVAKKFVEDLGNRMVDALRAPSSTAARSGEFTEIMLDCLDFDAIGTMALGRLARAATPDQKREFTPLFTAYMIDVTIARFGSLPITSFGLGSVVLQPNGDARIYTRITAGDRPREVYWRVHNTDSGIKVNDIVIEGASLAIHYHGEFERVGDATLTQLILRLRELTKGSRTLSMVQQATR